MKIQVTSDDVSLFHLALRYFSDAMQWWRIAEKNGLSDPDLTCFDAPVQIILPDESVSYGSEGLPPS
ncbi:MULTISPECIES: hypothetical protein [Asaia]|uniref:LysM domain-containing protein n=2 Tax=Asaia TaxID=91914 RepID=A0ABQ1M6Y4_9PROT|nr:MULTISPECIES: hypothetical protein [Asaia]GBR06244.1 hypothetical protein AA0323_1321 [Asaia siamensis NRIC 0323]GBR12381.1 hypothetical protein AA105894_0509 [Asaia spathodeae NBRC 105894]GGC34729.1 hypothetical protein GCM10007207_20310 [Asaia siamensis]